MVRMLKRDLPKREDTDVCAICLDDIKEPKILKCGDKFCSECIAEHLKTKNNCPLCRMTFGTMVGNQPLGNMKSDVISTSLPGYENYKTIRIEYSFPGGIQGVSKQTGRTK